MIAISKYELDIVLDIVSKLAWDCDVLLFGSRNKWTYRDGSDLDLAFVKKDGKRLDMGRVQRLKEAFEESNLPYSVDVVNFNSCSDEFKAIIDQENTLIYTGFMDDHWETVKLSDVCIGGGKYGIAAAAVDFSEDLPTYLRITDINDDGTLNVSGFKSVADTNAANYYLMPNDIVFARTGASTGRNYFYDGTDGDFVYAGFLIKFSIDPEKINPLYVKYYCQSKEYRDWVASFNTGSTRGNINAVTLGNMPIPNIPKKQQDLIADTLSALDDKIANTTKINHHLEQMAQTIFKSWFVDFDPWGGIMPSDWRDGMLSEIANITMGQSPSGTSYNEDGIGTVFYQGRAEFGSRFPTRRLFTTEPKRMAAKDDVLMSVRAPVGDLNVAFEPCCLGRGLAGIQSNSGHQSFVLYTMFALKQQLDMFNGEGTVFGSINKNDMANLPVIIPTDEVIRQFQEVASPMDSTIETNYAEICNLQAARDSLLPRLMSGELSVAEVTAK